MRLTDEMSQAERDHLDSIEANMTRADRKQSALMALVCFVVLGVSWLIGMVWP